MSDDTPPPIPVIELPKPRRRVMRMEVPLEPGDKLAFVKLGEVRGRLLGFKSERGQRLAVIEFDEPTEAQLLAGVEIALEPRMRDEGFAPGALRLIK